MSDDEFEFECECGECDFDDEDMLDYDLMTRFTDEIGIAVDNTLSDFTIDDCRCEMVTVLLSVAAQIAIDMGVTEAEYENMALGLFEETEEHLKEHVVIDNSKLN